MIYRGTPQRNLSTVQKNNNSSNFSNQFLIMYADLPRYYYSDNPPPKKKNSGTLIFPFLSSLKWYVPSGCKDRLFLYAQMKLQTSLYNYFKKHPVLNNIVLWRKLHAGKQQHTPHMALLFLLKAFISRPEPVFHKIVKKASVHSWCWNRSKRYREKLLWRRLCVSNVPGPH